MNFKKYKKGTMLLEVQSLSPERFVNLLWKNEVYARGIRKINITTVQMTIDLKDYNKISEISRRTNAKVKILKRQGIAFFLIRRNKVAELMIGCMIFISVIYYLSTFIWKINVDTERYISPYEVRQQLRGYGVNIGIKKSDIDVHKLENKILKDNDNIMWVKARIEGVNLKVQVSENQAPPKIVQNNEPCQLVAKRDGEIVRVYTTAGTAVVKEGVIVKKGELLVKAEQGKEGETYPVHAKGDIIAKTFYEEEKEVPSVIEKRQKTGNKAEKVYVVIKGRKIYLKNDLNKFHNYDRIVYNNAFIKKELYFEVKDRKIKLSKDDIVNKAVKELTEDIVKKLDKSVKVVDKVVDVKYQGGNYKIRLLLVGEENIAIPEKIEVLENKTD